MELKKIDEKLIELYKQAEKELIVEIIQGIQSGRFVEMKKKVLDDVKKILAQLGVDTQTWLNISIPSYYLEGLAKIDKDKADEIKKLLEGKPETAQEYITTNFGQVHTEAVNNLLLETGIYFSDAIKGVERGTKWSLAQAEKINILELLAKAEIKGESIQDIKKQIEEEFKQKGIIILKDKTGRNWSLSNYADLLVRTETAKASNQAVINRAIEVGITKLKRIEHSDCCEVCAPHNGEIWDIKKQGIPPELYHPRCRGEWVPIFD